jgi:hypothetical protein
MLEVDTPFWQPLLLSFCYCDPEKALIYLINTPFSAAELKLHFFNNILKLLICMYVNIYYCRIINAYVKYKRNMRKITIPLAKGHLNKILIKSLFKLLYTVLV